ncbi:hypothetical protein [Rhodococcoides navarretei]|uniref:Lipoprotein n=1 Tax=Rhodococcus navarretei TaxID=3128981 RepID=A0ABU9CSP6_9NOCA
MRTEEIVVRNVDGVVYDPNVSPSARAPNAVALTARDDNPSIETAAHEHERIATDEAAINNLRAARAAGEGPSPGTTHTTQECSMTYGPQWEYKETEYNLSLYLRDPDNAVRHEVDRIVKKGAAPDVIDGGAP